MSLRPLNYSILKYMTTVEKASYVEILEALKSDYANYKQFNKKAIAEALMTAEKNFLLEECGFELNDDGTGRFYYKAPPSGAETINNYIK